MNDMLDELHEVATRINNIAEKFDGTDLELLISAVTSIQNSNSLQDVEEYTSEAYKYLNFIIRSAIDRIYNQRLRRSREEATNAVLKGKGGIV